jgi:N-glycosylase/DNA lyase
MSELLPAMADLLARIDGVVHSPTMAIVNDRLAEFASFRSKSSHENFKELCFCILTANSTADLCMKVHSAIGDKFLTATCEDEFRCLLKDQHARFYNNRARFIASACQFRDNLKDILDSFGEDEVGLRQWLVDNIMGLGYKEASHFMRNVGYENVAIIDFHIVDLLVANGLVEAPKTLNKTRYLAIESVLRDVAGRVGLSQGALDLVLWFLETGKILK